VDRIKDTYVPVKERLYGKEGYFKSRVDFDKRVRLESLLNHGLKIKDIAKELDLTRGTIWHERCRCKGVYNAKEAQENAESGGTKLKIKKSQLPLAADRILKVLYNIILECKDLKNIKSIRSNLIKSQGILENLLNIKETDRQPLSNYEEKEIISLHQQGKKAIEIAVTVKRSRTQVYKIIKKYKGNQDDDFIKSKWLKK